MIKTAADEPRREHTPPKGVTWHPYAELFPWIEGSAFRELVEDIRKNGVLEPIVFLDGAVLDGRNRYMAARELGIDYPRVEFGGPDPLAFVIAKNLARRHLTESQRAMVAAKMAKLPKGTNQHTAIAVSSPTQEQAAATLNVSVDAVQRARRVQEQGAPELIAAVESGETSVSAAAEVAKLPKEEQVEAVAKGEVQKKASESRKRRQKPAAIPEPPKSSLDAFESGKRSDTRLPREKLIDAAKKACLALPDAEAVNELILFLSNLTFKKSAASSAGQPVQQGRGRDQAGPAERPSDESSAPHSPSEEHVAQLTPRKNPLCQKPGTCKWAVGYETCARCKDVAAGKVAA